MLKGINTILSGGGGAGLGVRYGNPPRCGMSRRNCITSGFVLPAFLACSQEVYLIVWNSIYAPGAAAVWEGRGNVIGWFRRRCSDPFPAGNRLRSASALVPSVSPGHRRTTFPILLWG